MSPKIDWEIIQSLLNNFEGFIGDFYKLEGIHKNTFHRARANGVLIFSDNLGYYLRADQKKTEDVLIENSEVRASTAKRHILNNNLLDYVCVECGQNDNWNGKTLTLHLDHINGINSDNRLSNLRFLCPNCHTQTETYCKNKKGS